MGYKEKKFGMFLSYSLLLLMLLFPVVACNARPQSEIEPNVDDLKEIHLLEAWQFQTSDRIRRIVGVTNNLLILYTQDARFTALDIDSGEMVWQFQASGIITDLVSRNELALKDDLLVFSSFVGESTQKRLTVLDAKDGQELWHQEELGGFVAATFAVGDEYIYWGIRPYYLAFDRHTGKPIWHSDLETGPRGYDGLLYNGDDLVVIQSPIYVLDAQTGQTKRSLSVTINSTPSKIRDDIIYVEKDESDLFRALDIENDTTLWQQQLDVRSHLSWTPLIEDDKIYVDIAGSLGVLDANTGAIIWESTLSGGNRIALGSNPAFFEDFIYLLVSDGSLRILDQDNGVETNKVAFGPVEREAALYATEQMLFVSLGGTTVYAYRFDDLQ